MAEKEPNQKITVAKDGPYLVKGNLPLVKKTQVVSEYGEPLAWKKEGEIETQETYALCRCGHSTDKPFCSGAHKVIGFDGTETAYTDETKNHQGHYPGGTHIDVKMDSSLCMSSGFCSTRDKGTDELVRETDNTNTRSQVMAMVERCPSGTLTYSIESGETDIEPDLPKQVALTTEITSNGAIAGPLWVTGGVPVERSDGKPCETRNRMTLCNCGQSSNKPFCDGSHRVTGKLELRKKKAMSKD
jgi:CDGSH-type Zn-finger protein